MIVLVPETPRLRGAFLGPRRAAGARATSRARPARVLLFPMRMPLSVHARAGEACNGRSAPCHRQAQECWCGPV